MKNADVLQLFDFAVGCDSGFGKYFHQQRFKPTEITMQILPALAQVDDRITNQLSGPMISCLAPAIDQEEKMRKMCDVSEARLVTGAADGVDRIVLQE